MKWNRVTYTQNDEAWFEDFAQTATAREGAELPPETLSFGNVEVHWHPTRPGHAHIHATGGSTEDRQYAAAFIREALAGHGYERQQYSLEWDRSDETLIKEADWQDIEAKAKRLVQSGKVRILRNGANVVVGNVEGDHGDYQTEFSRDDPNSESLTMWQCGCPWDQFAWQRTRQWKKYEGRVCAHVLATYWLSKTLPLDEEYGEGGEGGGPEGGQPENPVPGSGGMVPPGASPGMLEPQQAPGNAPAPNVPGQAPEPAQLMPEFPGNPELMPAVNPVSVPGGKPQTPLNPVQNVGVPGVGGTFSHVAAQQQYQNGDLVRLKREDFGTTVGLNSGQGQAIPAGSEGEVLGTDPTTGLVNVLYSGKLMEGRGKLEPHGVEAWHWPGDIDLSPRRPPGPAVRRRK